MSLPGSKINLNGMNYHVFDQGKGDQVVLLLHGMPDTSSIWEKQVPDLLNASFRVVAPDMLGYGKTDKPVEVERYASEKVIGDIVSLIETLGVEQVDLVGHDWGAFASWEIATNLPQLVRRHVSISVGHLGVVLGDLTVQGPKENWYMYLNTQPKAAELYAYNDCEFYRTYMLQSHPALDEVCERLKDPVAMQCMLNWDCANQLADIFLESMQTDVAFPPCEVPTMGIWSSGDTFLMEEPVAASDQFMKADWRYERIEGGSHWVMWDRPEETTRLVLDWLKP